MDIGWHRFRAAAGPIHSLGVLGPLRPRASSPSSPTTPSGSIGTDPAEDTPASIRAFLRRHRVEASAASLVGSERELRPLWTALAVLPSLDTGDNDVHSTPVRIYDWSGVWVSTLHAGADLTPESLANGLRLALGGS